MCAEREREKYGTKYARKLGEEFANKELSTEHSTISKQFQSIILLESGVPLENVDPLAFLSEPNLSSSDCNNKQIHIIQFQNGKL